MFFLFQKNKIGQRVIESIEIDMMNVETIWRWTIRIVPDSSVLRLPP